MRVDARNRPRSRHEAVPPGRKHLAVRSAPCPRARCQSLPIGASNVERYLAAARRARGCSRGRRCWPLGPPAGLRKCFPARSSVRPAVAVAGTPTTRDAGRGQLRGRERQQVEHVTDGVGNEPRVVSPAERRQVPVSLYSTCWTLVVAFDLLIVMPCGTNSRRVAGRRQEHRLAGAGAISSPLVFFSRTPSIHAVVASAIADLPTLRRYYMTINTLIVVIRHYVSFQSIIVNASNMAIYSK